ncbi:hypothetical protein BGY98DRAFT_1006112 [Russula aff. rugulosa BPL654]|nr:hypothetical protein BGY98DRAFT_1006112 [Russula aff. rugulosa BPL654]
MNTHTQHALLLCVFCSNTGSFRSPLIFKCRGTGRNLPLMMEWSLSLCPPSRFGLRWIHVFEGTLELLEPAFLGNFGGSIQLLRNYNLLLDDRCQICDMTVHHLAVLHPLLNKCFEPFHSRPLQERWKWSDDDQ